MKHGLSPCSGEDVSDMGIENVWNKEKIAEQWRNCVMRIFIPCTPPDIRVINWRKMEWAWMSEVGSVNGGKRLITNPRGSWDCNKIYRKNVLFVCVCVRARAGEGSVLGATCIHVGHHWLRIWCSGYSLVHRVVYFLLLLKAGNFLMSW